MSKNLKSDGNSLAWVVTTTDIVSGELRMIADTPGVAISDAAVGEDVTMDTKGVFEVPKVNGAINLGQKVYFEPVSKKVTTATDDGASPLTVYKYVGRAWKAAANLDATVEVRLTNQ